MAIGLSIVLLDDDVAPSLWEILRDLAERWPEIPSAEEPSETENTLAFSLGADHVVLATLPAPMPWSDLEGPCATSLLWPDAADALRGHKAHILVTVMAELDPVPLATRLTQVTASVLAASPQALGVYWGNATLVVPKPMFIDFATDVMPNEPPLMIWVDARIGRDEHGKTTGFTHGMQALGHMEIETQTATDAPADLHERFFNLALYLIDKGPVIRDGDTVGVDADEKIKVVYAPSAFGHQGQVMRLEYTPTPPKKPRWKFWSRS